jgi:hypothetical protein
MTRGQMPCGCKIGESAAGLALRHAASGHRGVVSADRTTGNDTQAAGDGSADVAFESRQPRAEAPMDRLRNRR